MERDAPQSTPPATLCKAGCGFYGSPNFDSMCSKCFKEALKKKNQNPNSQNDEGSVEAVITTTTTLTMTSKPQASNYSDEKKSRIEGESQKRKAKDDDDEKARGLEDAAGYELPKKRMSVDGDLGKASPSGSPSPSSASAALLGSAAAASPAMQPVVSQSPTPSQSTPASVGATEVAGVSLHTSLETGSPTIPVVTPSAGSSSGATEVAAGLDDSVLADRSTDEDKDGKKPKKNRCHECRKKVGLTGFECRCGGLYCSLHRYSDKHKCSFDYHALGAEQIRKANPVVVSEKVQKI